MKQLLVLFLPALIFFTEKSHAQTVFKVQAGAGYIEHFSTGIGVSIRGKHQLFFLYGSNLYIKPADFSSFLLQYQRLILHSKLGGIDFNVGLKGGYAIYTNQYYQWKLFTAIPYLGTSYRVGEKSELFVEGGAAFNQALSLKRREYGEIGTYKDLLPEFKFGLLFSL
jgi:hypothetical protein